MRLPTPALLLLLSVSALRAERLPVETFAQPAVFNEMTLSRDGKFVAYIAEYESADRVFIRSVEKDGPVTGVDVPQLGVNLFGRIGNITWVSSKRLLVGANSGYVAIDRDGKDYAYLTGYARTYRLDRQDNEQLRVGGMLHNFVDRDSDRVLMAEYDPDLGTLRTGTVTSHRPNVISLDVRRGTFFRELENPGDVIGWLADQAGVIRVGARFRNGQASVIYRESEKAEWEALPGLSGDARTLSVLGFNDAGTILYVSKIAANGRSALYTYDLAKRRLGELLLSHDIYDIDPRNGARLVKSASGRLLGVRYETDLPRVLWLDPTFAAIQHQLDQALPNAINTITSITTDEQVMLVISHSARNPGTYYLFDRAKGTLGKFVDARPWVKPEQMAEMLPLKLTSRDGLKLYGYLTVPLGRQMKNLPVVVLPHGGPWVRDSYGFDPEVQLLANRGYAVLQVNYRGSVGYGREFYERGFKQVGTKIQDDIEDATRWLVKQGIADPKRIAIMGSSFGGYSVLMGLIRSPDLFRCGICIAGVTDWERVVQYSTDMNPDAQAFQSSMVGDPVADRDALRAVSPVYHADQIKSPLLIVHSHDDPTVPFEQTRELTAALDKAGRPYELVAKYNEPHGFFNYKNRIELYKRIDKFLAEHMPAD